jgi:hypothetical protein
MADTRVLKSKVEDYVRTWLQERFGKQFRSDRVRLTGVEGEPKTHEFDAVSENNTIICGVKSSSLRREWQTFGPNLGRSRDRKRADRDLVFILTPDSWLLTP